MVINCSICIGLKLLLYFQINIAMMIIFVLLLTEKKRRKKNYLEITFSCKQNYSSHFTFRLFTNDASQCQGQRRDKQEQTGTKQGQNRYKAGTRQGQAMANRDISFLSLLVLACPCLSLSVHACPCISLSVPVYSCLSLSVPVCPMHANLVFNFFFTFHLAYSITLSFNPNSSILVIIIPKVSFKFFFQCK